jgi:predicted transposase YbfD/YdcC
VAEQIRAYWGVENKVHWRRDVQGGEDRCRLRDANSACALALLRTALLALARHSGHQNLKAAQEAYAHRPQSALRLLLFQRLASPE